MLPSEYVITKKISVDKTLKYEYFMDKNHPLANKSGKVYLHRHVASVKLGRWLDNEDAHHKDTVRGNNQPDNVVVMTRSEHAKEHHPPLINRDKVCKECKTPFIADKEWSEFCSHKCCSLNKRKFNPTKEEIEAVIWLRPTSALAKEYGVSDKAFEKRCKLLGIGKPPRGYWNKKNALVSAPPSKRENRNWINVGSIPTESAIST